LDYFSGELIRAINFVGPKFKRNSSPYEFVMACHVIIVLSVSLSQSESDGQRT